MARPSSLWQRKSDGWWYTTYQGKQYKLAKDKQEARRALNALQADPPIEQEGYRPSVKKIGDLYLDYSSKHNEADTYEWQRRFLQNFCDFVPVGERIRLGNRKVAELKAYMVTQWLDSHSSWGHSTKVSAVAIVKGCLNWAVQEGHLKTHPLLKLRRGRTDRRERILTANEKLQIHSAIKDVSFGHFLLALEQTGARPYSEMAKTTAANVDLEAGTITLQKWKNRKRTGRPRTIFLTPKLAELLRYLATTHPDGPLFRNNRTGEAWNKESVSQRLNRLEGKLGIKDLTAYAWRHTYITECLAKGMSASIVAELVGNSPSTIAKYYDHLDQKKDILRAAAKQAVS